MMTLHDAIEKVLQESGHPMTAKEIADAVNKQQLYIRGDNNPVPSSQIHARVSQYPHKFYREGGKISAYKKDSARKEKKSFTDFLNLLPNKNPLFSNFKSSEFLRDSLFFPYLLSLYQFDNKIDDWVNIKIKFDNRNINPITNLNINLLFKELVLIFKGLSVPDAEKNVPGLIFYFRLKELISHGEFDSILRKDDLVFFKENFEKKSIQLFDSLKSIDKTEYFNGIFTPLLNSIDSLKNKLNETLFGLIINVLEEYDFRVNKISIDSFGRSFNDYLLKYLVVKDKAGTNSWTPAHINQILINLLNPPNGKKIYDPCIGLGGSFIELKRHFDKNGISEYEMIGQEKIQVIASLCRMNLIANGIYNSQIFSGDSLLEPCISSSSVDIVLFDPPILRLDKDYFDSVNYNNHYFKINSNDSSQVFIQFALSRLNQNGKAAVLVDDSIISGSRAEKLREFLVNNDFLEIVISLPPTIYFPNPSLKVSLILLNKNKEVKKKEKIIFCNFRRALLVDTDLAHDDDNLNIVQLSILEFIKSYHNGSLGYIEDEILSYPSPDIRFGTAIVVNKAVINENHFNFNPEIYSSEISLELKKLADSGEKLITLEELIHSSGSLHKDKPPFEKNDYTNSPVVRIRDLSDDFFNHSLKLSELSSDKTQNTPIPVLNSSALLLALVGEKLKPTYFKFQGTPIILSENVYPLIVNENLIYLDYLIYQLSSDIVKRQLDLIKRGGTIPFFSKRDILKLKIPFPSYSEQINLVSRYKKEQQSRFRLAKFINEIKLVSEYEQMKHEIEIFARKYFPSADQVEFKTLLQFENPPFNEDDVIQSKYVKYSKDGLIQHLLIIDQYDKVNGVITISETKEISYEKYSEINAYANFLIKVNDYINKSSIDENFERFAHTSKSFFNRLQSELDSLINSPNIELIKALSTYYVDSAEHIKNSIEEEGMKEEDFLAINKLNGISKQISGIAKFYLKSDAILKNILQGEIEKFNIKEVLNDINECEEINLIAKEEDIYIVGKREAIKQSLMDLIQNARRYSPNNRCKVKLSQAGKIVELCIENKVVEFITEERYKNLGRVILANSGKTPSCGMYWAMKAIKDSNGEVEKVNYNDYREQKIFKLNVRFKKI